MIYKDRQLRHELKYPATAAQCEIMRQRFSAVMHPDSHGDNGKYRITSLYLDDIYMTAYNDKLVGFDTRKKYRIRTYNLDDSHIHFECKYKDRDMVSKRGIWIDKAQYKSILDSDFTFAWDDRFAGTILDEASVSNAAARLMPSVIVDYNREAFVNPEGNVRFTIDSGFKVGVFSNDMFSSETQYIPINDIAAVIEIKYDDFLPSYLGELIQGAGLEYGSVSKFMMCRTKLSSMHLI